jgi:hypothetical protein
LRSLWADGFSCDEPTERPGSVLRRIISSSIWRRCRSGPGGGVRNIGDMVTLRNAGPHETMSACVQTSRRGRGQAWIRKLQRAYSKGTIDPEVSRLVASIPGWTWTWTHSVKDVTTRQAEAAQWYQAEFMDDDISSVTSRWVRDTRSRYWSGSMLPGAATLLESLPGWSWGSPRVRPGDVRKPGRQATVRPTRREYILRRQEMALKQQCSRMEEFCALRGQSPSPSETTAYRTARKLRIAYANNDLPSELVSRLDAAPGWTWQGPPRGGRRVRASA